MNHIIDNVTLKKKFLKKMFYFFIFLFLICNVFQVKADDEKIIKVAVPIQKGLFELKEDGSYSGYTYDYLMEISRYTNWKYEFIRADGDLNNQLSALYDKLLAGDIDIMGATLYNDSLALSMDYSGYNYGICYSSLCVLASNTEINSSNYTTLGKLRVAVYSKAKSYVYKLDQFAIMNGFEIEKVYCENEEELLQALIDNKADALLEVDVNIVDDRLRTIARFAPEPFYFAVTKGKTDIVNQLNSAISSINEANPYFMTTLHEKYFTIDKHELYLSKSEKDYIRNAGVIDIAAVGKRAPIQYKDSKTGELKGISIEVLNYISEQTGLKFNVHWVSDYTELNNLLNSGNIEMAAGIIDNATFNLIQKKYTLSNPYVSAPISLALNKNVNPNKLDNKRLALTIEDENNIYYQGNKIYYNSILECLQALHSGTADYCYGNSYIFQYYINSQGLKDIMIIPQPENQIQNVSFAFIKPTDVNLISIINKSIQSIPENEMQKFLYANAFQVKEITLMSYIKANTLQSLLILTLIVMVFFSIVISFYAYNYKKSSLKNKLESERYEQISELSNEFIYEYDIRHDKLKLPEKCASYLGCEKEIKSLSKFIDKNNNLFSYISMPEDGTEEIIYDMPNGEQRWMKIITKIIFDSYNKPIFSIGKIIDIQKEKEKQNELLEKSQKDSLTDIYNAATSRNKIIEYLEVNDENGALFIIDVDYFKSINDNYGHYTGDFVLIAIAEHLKSIFESDAVVGRLGGDEFIVFMKGITDIDIVKEKCTLIKNEFKKIKVADKEGIISASIGVTFVKHNQNYSELYKRADEALYVVKRRGRDGFEIA